MEGPGATGLGWGGCQESHPVLVQILLRQAREAFLKGLRASVSLQAYSSLGACSLRPSSISAPASGLNLQEGE